MIQNKIFTHKESRELLKLIKLRESNINTFVVVDINGNPIIEERNWSSHPDTQLRIIKGFDNLYI